MREVTCTEIKRRRISAIIRAQDRDLAERAMQAAVEGGFRIVEITLTTPGAFDLVARFAGQRELLVGAGTVLSAEQARAAAGAGARFLVSPVFDPGMIDIAHQLGAAFIPGTFTPTEMYQAHQAGADFVKLFPSPVDVIETVTAILGPLPFLNIFPTAGVTADNVAAVLRAGAAGAGFVRALFTPQAMAARDFEAIRRQAEWIVQRAAAAGDA